MSDKLSRRDFLKVAGAGIAATAILTGCGPDSRYVVREPYTKMPEYTYNGLSTYYASTCRECPAGCGIVVRTMQGRALKVEGNANNPVNLGKTCSRGQASLQGLYNPDRIQNPLKQQRGGGSQSVITWDQAVAVVQNALGSHKPGEIAFLLGMAPDHLADLVTLITTSTGSPAPWRYGAFALFEGRSTLAKAAGEVFGIPSIPFFDMGSADLTFSFGANFLETYLSPVAYGRGYSSMRRAGRTGKRGYLVQFEPRLSQTAAAADEWIPVVPGTEGLVAFGIGRAVADLRGGNTPLAYQNADLSRIAEASGVSQDTIKRLAGLFASASHPLAIPGGSALAASNGLEAGQAILTLNVLANNLGQDGGVFLTPALPVHDANTNLPRTFTDIQSLVSSMKSGAIQVLFIHGVNPLFEFPESLGFSDALGNVPTVISFASFPDETSRQADYILPDHTGLESWGYQKIVTGSDRPVISGAQPVVAPFYNTKATADVLLAAIQAIGGSLAAAVPFKDEIEFLQDAVQNLVPQNGYFNAPDPLTFWAEWQQYGGWWNGRAGLSAPAAPGILSQPLVAISPEFDGEGEFYLFPFPSPILGDGSGANKPWLQETPDPTTTVMWNSWVEIHPDTAAKLGVTDDDVVKITSPFGEIELSVYRYPAIRPDTIAIPFGQGHTVYGRYAENRGANLAQLLGDKINAAGDLAIVALK
ncbi:MAG TPA: molybdopterin-dependent oxidoreductase, partial [Anaerolineales bacterium]|nr:molybdopterin-dependent oxidoreductase [Anaerolineales bacterium]